MALTAILGAVMAPKTGRVLLETRFLGVFHHIVVRVRHLHAVAGSACILALRLRMAQRALLFIAGARYMRLAPISVMRRFGVRVTLAATGLRVAGPAIGRCHAGLLAMPLHPSRLVRALRRMTGRALRLGMAPVARFVIDACLRAMLGLPCLRMWHRGAVA